MWNQLLQALCELTGKLDALISEVRGGRLTPAGPSRRIGSSISPVMRQGTTPVRLVNANPGRLGVVVHNNSNGELMIALDGDRVDPSYYTFKIRAGETLHFDLRTYGELYKGAFMGLWDDASGAEPESKALVTEIYWTS